MSRAPAPADLTKEVATLIATAACAGVEVRAEADGAYTVGRWGLSKRCATLQEARDLLARMGVRTS